MTTNRKHHLESEFAVFQTSSNFSNFNLAPTVKRYKYEKRLCDGRVSPKIEAFLSRLQERQKEKREFCAFFNSLRLAPDLCALDA